MTHGTGSGYAKHGCRCPDCTRAQRERVREYRARRKDAMTSDRGATTQGSNVAPRDAGTSGGLAPNNGGSMRGQRYTQPGNGGGRDG